MINKKEARHYLMVQRYLLNRRNSCRIHSIRLSELYSQELRGPVYARVSEVFTSTNGPFMYEYAHRMTLDLSSDNYLSFVRESTIDTVLSSGSLNTDQMIEEYKNNLHPIKVNYYTGLYNYIHELKNYSLLSYRRAVYVKMKTNEDKQGSTSIVCCDTGEMVKNVPYSKLSPFNESAIYTNDPPYNKFSL